MTKNILQRSHFRVCLRVLKDKDINSKWRRLRIIIQISTHWKTMGDCKHYLHHTPTLTEPTIILTCALIRLNAGFWGSGTYVCVCLLHSLSRGQARENTEPGKSGVTHANTWKNRRLLFPRGLIFTGDTQVTFRLQLFRYACVCTILFLCSTFFNVCVPSQTFLYACICALCVEKALKHVCAQTCTFLHT